jgi:3-hydroxy-9,10-secoandrosta-1,3,5(10)-triene-9,17-dione monooxygenase
MATETSSAGLREELIKRAADLGPTFKERAKKTEQLRQMPEESIKDLLGAGLMRIGTPQRFGGNGLDYDASFDVTIEVARACGSTGWCFSVWSSHNWIAGHWPLEAQEEYFAPGPDVLSSSSVIPTGKLTPVDGGYRVSGRWSFSSGSDAGTCVMLGGMTTDHTEAYVIIPRGEYEIVDTWHVSGLKGTGSKDIVVDDVFVPAHRVVLSPSTSMGDPPWSGWEIHQRPSYRVPLFAMWPMTLSSPCVGMAFGAVDDFTSRLAGTSGRGRTADSVAVQLRLAEASAEADAAATILRVNCQELLAKGAEGHVFTLLERARASRNVGYMTKLSVQAVNRLFEASGGHALFDSQPIQRFHRDVHAASHHVALYWDPIAEFYGRTALGLPFQPMF